MFETIDPETGLPPEEPFAGFLPVNNSTHVGEGFVSYSVAAGESTETGDTITASAEIIFDKNQPILTNTARNMIDAQAPASRIDSIPDQVNRRKVELSANAADDPSGSGIQDYDIFVSENGGAYNRVANGQSGSVRYKQ